MSRVMDWGRLNSVNEPFDEPIEPISVVEEINEGVLQEFAQYWEPEPFNRAVKRLKPEHVLEEGMKIWNEPKDVQDLMKEKVSSFDDSQSGGEDTNFTDTADELIEELEPPTMDPPALKRNFSIALDWNDMDFNVSKMAEEMMGEGVRL